MNKSEAKPLKIGDKIYKYLLGGVGSYDVIGKREYQDNIQYHLRCNNCNHPEPCELLITLNDYGQYVYVAMLNDDEDEPQYSWHTGEPFFLTKQEAIIQKGNESIKWQRDGVEKLRDRLKGAEEKLKEMKIYIESVNEELKIDRRDE